MTTKQQLIDDVQTALEGGNDLNLNDYIEAMEEIADDCSSRAEASRTDRGDYG